jgi:hypothetical protein
MTDVLVAGIVGFMCGAVFGALLVMFIIRRISTWGRTIRQEQKKDAQLDTMLRMGTWEADATPVSPKRTDGWD